MKSMFQALGSADNPFGWPKTGMAVPDMSNWVRIQQDMAKAGMEFGQRMAAMAKSDLELSGNVLRRLMQAKTPEELVAWQRDMLELVSSKYFEQWMTLGEQVRGFFDLGVIEAPEPETTPEPEGGTKPKKVV
jgi:hypothetical protein